MEALEATGHSVKTLTALNIDDPASRYPSAQAVARDLESYLEGGAGARSRARR